jgi:hypothetical protein
MKTRFEFRKLMLVIVSLTTFVSSSNAQETPPFDSQSRSRLSEEFVLERISGKENPESISDSYAVQFLTPMLLTFDASLIKSRMSALGITNDQIVEIKSIATALHSFNGSNMESGVSGICQSEEYQLLLHERSDPQAFVDLMANLEVSTSEAYENFFRSQVINTMGAEFYANLMLWIDENIKPVINSVKIDHVKRAAALNVDLFNNYELICQKYNI